jgi:hypothetical protein
VSSTYRASVVTQGVANQHPDVIRTAWPSEEGQRWQGLG